MISLKPSHIKRYKDIAALLIKYGRGDLLQADEFAELRADSEASRGLEAKAEDLARDLEAMGPTYVKLGQVLSSRSDLLPAPYLAALSRLQDDVEPFPFEDVERIVQEDLGVRLSKAFADFESTPVAAASLGQVHRATLRDGRRVAVKVQRPEIRARIATDLEVLAEMASVLDSSTETGRAVGFADVHPAAGRITRPSAC